MCGSVAFLAVLVWFFSAESRSDTFHVQNNSGLFG